MSWRLSKLGSMENVISPLKSYWENIVYVGWFRVRRQKITASWKFSQDVPACIGFPTSSVEASSAVFRCLCKLFCWPRKVGWAWKTIFRLTVAFIELELSESERERKCIKRAWRVYCSHLLMEKGLFCYNRSWTLQKPSVDFDLQTGNKQQSKNLPKG